MSGYKLFCDARTFGEWPEIRPLVEGFAGSREFDPASVRKALKLSERRLAGLMDFLVSSRLASLSVSGRYRWSYDLSRGIQEIEVADAFV